jgi:galactokinase/mevalonate kinase-like predicted kinase
MGAKLLGAGGGGYMLALTESKSKIRQEFSDRTCLDVGIAHEGARVVYTD